MVVMDTDVSRFWWIVRMRCCAWIGGVGFYTDGKIWTAWEREELV